MIMPYEFDEANQQRRKRIHDTAMRTAKKINERLNHFIKNTERNPSLTQEQKNTIIKTAYGGKWVHKITIEPQDVNKSDLSALNRGDHINTPGN